MTTHITFTDQSAVFIAGLQKRRRVPLKNSSLATIRSHIRAVEPVLGETNVFAIENDTLKRLVDKLVDDGFSSRSIHAITNTAKRVVASVRDEKGNRLIVRGWDSEYIDLPPAKNLEETSVLQSSEIERMLVQVASPYREFIVFQAASGLRRGEVLALNVEDFDSAANLVHVTRTLGYHGETSTKTVAGKREVDLHPDVVAMLCQILKVRATGRLFDVTNDQVRYVFAKLNLKSHALRHFRYTQLQKKLVHPAILNYWLGHSGEGMSAIYGHTEQDREMRQRIAREVGLGFRLPEVLNTTLNTDAAAKEFATA